MTENDKDVYKFILRVMVFYVVIFTFLKFC